MATHELTPEEFGANLSPDHFIADTIKDPMQRPIDNYMKSKYIVENMNRYLKWIDTQYNLLTPYAFTLTTNITDSEKFLEEEQKMILAATKILTQNTNPIVDGEAYLEYTANGAPHIHGWYKTKSGGRVYAKIFKRHWSLWNEDKRIGDGHQGGYHKKMKSIKYHGYASAEDRLVYKVKTQA